MRRLEAALALKSQRIKTIIAIVIMVFIIAPLSSAYGTSITDLNQQKKAASQKAKEYKQQASTQNNKVESLNTAIHRLNNQIVSMESRIATTNGKIIYTKKQIRATEQQITQKNIELAIYLSKQAEALQALYLFGQSSAIESLISSDSISEVMARDQYVTSLEQKIESMMHDIKILKDQLEAKKEDLKQKNQNLLNQKKQQEALRSNIVSQKNQQNILLDGALAQKKQILNNLAQAQDEIEKISAAEAAYRRRIAAKHRSIIGGSSYPYDGMSDPEIIDPWGFYTTECVSYAAWYWNVKLNKPWHNTRPGHGSAKYWSNLAHDQGYSVSQTPRVGAIISWTGGVYGHVAIVESINSDGTLDISDYNYIPHQYSYTKHIDPAEYARSSFSYIY